MKKIHDFIHQFNKQPGAVDMFTKGMCYWFAFILVERFGGDIVYSSLIGHFMADIGGRLYDITGDVTERYSEDMTVKSFEYIKRFDPLLAGRIERDCINKERFR